MRLSKSKINMFENCKFRFFRTVIQNWKPEKIPKQLAKGIEVHEHMEHATKNAKTIQEVKQNIQNRTIKEEQVIDIINFFNWQKERRLPLYIEQKFFDEELNLSGIVDRIDLNKKGELCVIDYKTGKGKWIKTKDTNTGQYIETLDWTHYRFELAIYTYLFEKHHNQKISNWGIFFTTKNKYIDEPVIQEEIVNAIAHVRQVRKEISQAVQDNNWSKNPSYLCKWCEIFQNNECDGGMGEIVPDRFNDAGEMVL